MITELRIENFRGFHTLELKGLKRVNLVVGENNSGKTSLLEALWVLCDPSQTGQLPGLLRPLQGSDGIRVFRWLLRDELKNQLGQISGVVDQEAWTVGLGRPEVVNAVPVGSPPYFQRFAISKNLRAWTSNRNTLRARVISVQYVDAKTQVLLVGKAQRKQDGEEKLQSLLGIVDSRIKKVRVDPGDADEGSQVIVDLGLSELVPVSQAGQGVYRLVTILAEIIGESPDVVLIDEVENGLHHTIHEQVWTGLAETAEKLGVQIFATTHSGECLAAAHEAFCARDTYDLSVIQLFRLESAVKGRVLDRALIDAAIAGNIELR